MSWTRIARTTAFMLLAVTATVFLVTISCKHGFGSQTMASWVQAFGSIGAIVGAVWISGRQHRKNVELEDERAIEFKRRLKSTLRSIFEPYFLDIESLYESATQAQGRPGHQGDLVTGNTIRISRRTEDAIELLQSLREAIAHDPLLLMRYSQLLIALKYVIEICDYEKRQDQWRWDDEIRTAARMHLPRSASGENADDPIPPVDMTHLGESINDAKAALEQFQDDLS